MSLYIYYALPKISQKISRKVPANKIVSLFCELFVDWLD